jgi:predicted transcriptional regulator
MSKINNESNKDILKMSSDIASAYLGNNIVPAEEISDVIKSIFNSLKVIESVGVDGDLHLSQKPAVPVNKSITPDYIICLEDGKQLKMLKRHIRTVYNLSPEAYRKKWGLPADYPMVSPNYAKRRSYFAKQIGLGRKKSA